MPKIKVNDISMYYEMHGEGDPLVMIAGFSADHMTWLPLVEQLKSHYQVIIFDNRGAGQTDAPDTPYNIGQMTADVVGLCKALNISRAHFIGNSMGGFILQQLAHDYPDLVKSAVISNSTITIDTVFHIYVAAQYELLKANAPLPALVKASCAWAFSYRFLMQPNMLNQLVELTVANPYPFSLTGYRGQYAALDAFDSSAWVANIKVPVLVVAGDQDLIFRTSKIKMLADVIPGAKYYCFEECGHLPMLEYTAAFAEIIRDFLA